jgi:diguanylate cyclase (GGDEF)-like protein
MIDVQHRTVPSIPSSGTSVQPVIHGDRPAISIFAAPERQEALAETLLAIGYQAVSQCLEANVNHAEPLRSFSAAVVDDSVDNPLEWVALNSVECPVILVTSELSTQSRLAAARAGVSAIIPKPLDVSELAEWLNDLVGPHRETPLSILIIDDDEILAQTYASTLENAGMRVVVETNPSAVLRQMTALYPDLILMDVQMPGIDGVELARIIRQSRLHLALPIVFLSGERDLARQLEARTWGGDDFIIKPIDPGRLVSLVRMRADRAITLRSMMDRDSLTGLLNHGRFIERLYQELERCRRIDVEMSLVLIDLDHFKSINDSYGHPSGDQVLRTLARTLSVGLRRIDIIGRYGGEEFGVLLLDTPAKAAFAVADKIRQRFSAVEFSAKTNKFFVTFSAGIAGSRGHVTPEALISSADDQMYLAKAEGRNRIVGEQNG